MRSWFGSSLRYRQQHSCAASAAVYIFHHGMQCLSASTQVVAAWTKTCTNTGAGNASERQGHLGHMRPMVQSVQWRFIRRMSGQARAL